MEVAADSASVHNSLPKYGVGPSRWIPAPIAYLHLEGPTSLPVYEQPYHGS
jgi:hypothetical protein